jgi:hypothetical protein
MKWGWSLEQNLDESWLDFHTVSSLAESKFELNTHTRTQIAESRYGVRTVSPLKLLDDTGLNSA